MSKMSDKMTKKQQEEYIFNKKREGCNTSYDICLTKEHWDVDHQTQISTNGICGIRLENCIKLVNDHYHKF